MSPAAVRTPPGRHGRGDAKARDLRREFVGGPAQTPVEAHVDAEQCHSRDRPDDPERQPAESPLGDTRDAMPVRREVTLVFPALLPDDHEKPLADRLELTLAAL